MNVEGSTNQNTNNNISENISSDSYHKQEKYYESLKNFFINSLSILDILRNEDFTKTFNILKLFILNLRILIKNGSLESGIFLNKFWNLLYFYKTNIYNTENLVYYADSDLISNNFFELLMLVLIMANLSEYGYLKILLRQYFPLFMLQFYIKEFYKKFGFQTSIENFEKYFGLDNFNIYFNSNQYSSEMKNHFNFYLRKITLMSKIHEQNVYKTFRNSFETIEEEFSYYIKELGFKENFEILDFLEDGNL